MGTTESILAEPGGRQYPGSALAPPAAVAIPRPSRRLRPSTTPVKNVVPFKLHGIVIGLPSSGKRSLLRRLEGKDPFREPPTEHTSKIAVPYHAPGKTWGERIQLIVDIPSNFDQQPDFCILLINPRHDPRNLKPYVIKLMLMLFQSQSRLASVCVLVNFRDTQNRSPPPRLSEEDVKQWIGEAKLQHAEAASLPLIQTGVSSMKNCYGLNILHHFIYQSYLNRKRLELEEQLQDIMQASHESMTMSTHMSYEEFLRILERPKIQKQQRQPSDRHAPNGVAPVSSPKQQQSNKQSPPARRTFHVSSTQTMLPPKGVDIKKTLDDFFADDDSNDGVVTGTKLNSSDDEEDDFYYDAHGNRAGAQDDTDEETAPPPSKQKLQSKVTPVSQLNKSKPIASDDMRNEGSLVNDQVQTEGVTTHMMSQQSSRQGQSKTTSLRDGDNVGHTSMQIPEHTQKDVGNEQGRTRVQNLENEIENSVATTQNHDDDDSNTTDENGWEDDDDGLDLDDDDDDLKGNNAKQHQSIETTPERNENSPAENGWDDELDVLDDISDNKVQSGTTNAVEDNVVAPGYAEEPDIKPVVRLVEDDANFAGGQQGQHSATLLSELPDGHSKSVDEAVVKESEGQSNDSPVEAIAVDAVHDDDEDDDDFMIGATEEGKLPQAQVQHNSAEDDEDDSEFMIAETSNHEPVPRMENKVEGITEDHRTKSNISRLASTAVPDADIAVPTARGVLSAAALAAIQAAEKEAQFMLEQDTAAQEDETHLKRLKKKKKKKDGDDKKRRKKSSAVVSDSSAAL